MPFEIVRNDITNMQVDAIVNPASRRVYINPGVDSAIHKKAGPKLLEARKAIGELKIGDAAITPGFNLDASYVIHAPSPIWFDGTKGETQHLLNTYNQCLQAAITHNCESIAFPLLGSGNHGYPKQKALQIAVQAFSTFLMDHDIHIYLVVFGKESFALSEKLVQKVASFIDEHYVDEYDEELYSHPRYRSRQARLASYQRDELCQKEDVTCEFCIPDFLSEKASVVPAKSVQSPVSPTPKDLTDFLKQKDDTFAVTLVDLIERSGKKNSEIYKKANVDKKLFSKIINNVKYHPSKQTALAFAIALELDLEQTQDLIGRAGYTLTHSSRFDLIIEYFILNKNYNIFEINEVLFEFDQVPLGY